MIRFEEAVKLIEQHCSFGGTEVIETPQAYTRILAEHVYSELDIPGFDNSAMDGYAIKSLDTSGASPDKSVSLELLPEEASAGNPKQTLSSSGTCLAIMTGGIIPEGADAVIQLEHVRAEENRIIITRPVPKGEHVRNQGEDIKQGTKVLNKGIYLNPGCIGQLVAIGKAKVSVGPKPRIAILATGNELIDYQQPNPDNNKVYSSNSYLLTAQIIRAGGIPSNLGIARDNLSELTQKISEGLENYDLFITTGGISAGKYDLVKQVMLELGVEEIFYKLKLKPGKPVFFGKYKGKPVFALPGNPASASVTFDLLVSIAISRFQGATSNRFQKQEAVLKENLRKKEGRRYFLRGQAYAEHEKIAVTTSGNQGSGMISSLANSNCLIELAEEITEIKAGSIIPIYCWK